MKLLRWPLAGVTAYVIYKYAIGKKAKGERVFDSPETGKDDASPKAPAKPVRAKSAKARKPKTPSAPKARKPKAVAAPRTRKPKAPPPE